MRNEEREVREQLDALRAELKDLRESLGEFANALKSEGRTAAASVATRIQEETMNRFGQLKDAYDNARDYGKRTYIKAQRKVEQKPMASLLAALAVGFVLGRALWGRRG